VSRQGDRWGLGSQDGYTALEMVITMALTGILSGAIFSSFLVLDRIQTAWQERDQARAVGVLAEQPMLRDVQAYKVVAIGSSPAPPLVLNGVSTDGTPIQVKYAVAVSPTGQSELQRSVTPCTSNCAGPVAHGVRSVAVTCTNGPPGSPPTFTVDMWLDAITTRSPAQPVHVSPRLTLTTRNLQVCP
jgi:prepilin-type N-terminal cleavage/methylation domain-containing protein